MPFKRKAEPKVQSTTRRPSKTALQSPSITGTSASSECFSLFPNLPKELRLTIWEMTLPESEVITVKAYRDKSAKKSLKFSRTSPPSPRLREVCIEAREIALRRYPFNLPIFVAVQPFSIGFGYQDTICVENWDRMTDIIRVDYDSGVKPIGNWALNIRHLAGPPQARPILRNGHRSRNRLMWRALSQFRNLETLRVIMVRKSSRYLLSQLSLDDLAPISKINRHGQLIADKKAIGDLMKVPGQEPSIESWAAIFKAKRWTASRAMFFHGTLARYLAMEGSATWNEGWKVPAVELMGLKVDFDKHFWMGNS